MTERYKHEYVNCEVSEIIDTVENESLTAEEITDRLNALNNENQTLKKELQRIYDTATANKTINILEKYYDKLLSDGSDEVKDAKRLTVLRCIEHLEEFKDEI